MIDQRGRRPQVRAPAGRGRQPLGTPQRAQPSSVRDLPKALELARHRKRAQHVALWSGALGAACLVAGGIGAFLWGRHPAAVALVIAAFFMTLSTLLACLVATAVSTSLWFREQRGSLARQIITLIPWLGILVLCAGLLWTFVSLAILGDESFAIAAALYVLVLTVASCLPILSAVLVQLTRRPR